eukprot:TRINITY_DN38225_c0_g1_i1.p1 TRINITY_DN38225_c0_g1~~TRINITY_DN38225_c0_g1_i1.p1  ORF type:complete len:1691 (+),score=329.54 TRINITY_DN38225_c0_g1_i1:637-5073(+)
MCVPEDCAFQDWSEWFYEGGCTGLCARHRGIESVNNDCGQPCTGPRYETKSCPRHHCMPIIVDCEFADWSDWGDCSSVAGQRTRTRMVSRLPVGEGESCVGATNETEPCGHLVPKDCVLSGWGDFTECSRTCGGGRKTRSRKIISHAANGGKACEGMMRDTVLCNDKPCEVVQDCTLSEWSVWSPCDSPNKTQSTRKRHVTVPASGGGKPCNESVREVAGCIFQVVAKDCILSNWTMWSDCSQTCDGGQRERKRLLIKPASDGGVCEEAAGGLRQVEPCGTQPCQHQAELDCMLSDWGEWKECSATCGIGETKRLRTVEREAVQGGFGCTGQLAEVKGCNERGCEKTDCVWNEWDDWGACSCTCGGGSKRRSRTINTAPLMGGDMCDTLDKFEIAPCATQSCEVCTDGVWGDWGDWGGCSATCESGFRKRHRDVATPPSSCGKAVDGLEDEYEKCEAELPCVPEQDCLLSKWTAWSSCSCSCFGIMERVRNIERYASGNGKSCVHNALKEVSPCNAGVGQDAPEGCKDVPIPCTFSSWSEWGQCSAECGGGDQTRVRTVAAPAGRNGQGCDGALSVARPCNTQKCPEKCVDCKWDEWTEWSDCRQCRDQKYRRRNILQVPNHCGKPCVAAESKEVTECTGNCPPEKYCAWSAWSDISQCSKGCGASSKLRSRSLTVFTGEKYKAAALGSAYEGCELVCGGDQLEYESCPYVPCGGEKPPVDCAFSSWTDWAAPSFAPLCERRRHITTQQQHGGNSCDGATIETKVCELLDIYSETDCVFSDWEEWSNCKTETSQRYRSRIIEQNGANGGRLCRGSLSQTEACSKPEPLPEPVKCVLQDWTPWTKCSVSCGGGMQHRARHVAVPAAHGGKGCETDVDQLRMCNQQPCRKPVDCSMGDWADWAQTKTFTGGLGNQLERVREVIVEGMDGGKACVGALHELKPFKGSIDCLFSAWAAWDKCDKTCDGGQQMRLRELLHGNMNDGKGCNDMLSEVQGCNTKPCKPIVDCEMGPFGPWSNCSRACGSGTQTRTRAVQTYARNGGKGCKNSTSETKTCKLAACSTVDCKWSDWTKWGGCSADCGGGVMERTRRIIRLPEKGGKLCDVQNKSEVAPCNIQSCSNNCVDGRWADWTPWGPCSRTCKGGVTTRSREIAMPGNSCGKPVLGFSHEVATCNDKVVCIKPVNCVFATWSEWSGCSDVCDGQQVRDRRIATHAKGAGKPCLGEMSVMRPCNQTVGPTGGMASPACEKHANQVNCNMSAWVASPCSALCDGGQQASSRTVLVHAKNGGKACEEVLAKTEPCNTQACPKSCKAQDCEWSDWTDWGGCDKCSGQMRRKRFVRQQGSCGGVLCNLTKHEEIAKCERECHAFVYCAWNDWESWGACTKTCGSGHRKRQRQLSIHEANSSIVQKDSVLDEAALAKHLELLSGRATDAERQRLQELVLSFGAGLVSFLSLGAGFRTFRRRSEEEYARTMMTTQDEPME